MSISIIQLGVGGFGRAWRRAIAEVEDAEVVALVDVKREALEEAAAHYGLGQRHCFMADEAWEEVPADLVVDSTPHLFHLQNARRAYPTGKSHLVVKPMADSWEAGLEMVELARKHGVRLIVGQQLRYHPLIEQVRALVAGGQIGTPTQLLLDFIGPLEGFLHREWRQPHPLLAESAIHQADFIRYVLDADAASVTCEAWTPNYGPPDMVLSAVAIYRMTNDVNVCYRGISTYAVTLQTGWLGRWMLEGDDGVIRVIGAELTLNGTTVKWGGGDVEAPSELDLNLPELNARVVRDAVAYIRDGIEPGISGQNNLNSLHMVMGAIESAETGKRVCLYRHEEK